MVEGVGFEPTKAEPTDLQSVPFGRSGTPPKNKSGIVAHLSYCVNCEVGYFTPLCIMSLSHRSAMTVARIANNW